MSYGFHHRLGGNKGSSRPTHVIFFDVESRVSPVKAKRRYFTPFLWTAIYRHYDKDIANRQPIKLSGTDIDAFWDEVESRCYAKTRTYLVSHNIVVDFVPMMGFSVLPGRGWIMDKLLWRQRVIVMTWIKDGKKLIIMNNGNLFDGSVADWGKVFGVPKLKMPADDAPMEEWVTYCMRDTEIVMIMWDNLLKFLDEHDLGNFQLTKASLAMTAFKHRFARRQIIIHHDDRAVPHERDSYHGGRFEAIQVGDFDNGLYYNLDITSMYGWIESLYHLPYELRGYTDHADLRTLKAGLERFSVIANVRVDVPVPVFPFRVGNKVTYPVGEFTTTLCTPEIVHALKHDWIKEVGSLTWYYQDAILADYAKYFLELKQTYEDTDNKPMRQLTKLYLNSLYGKFAQHGFEDSVIGECALDDYMIINSYDKVTQSYSQELHYGGKIHQVIETSLGYNSFVAIASHITAFGRMYLWLLMQTAGMDHVYHVATDSLIVDKAGYEALRDFIKPGVPGYLKLEATSQVIQIRDVNDLTFDGKDKIKGVSKTATRIGANDYEIETWPSLTSIMKGTDVNKYYINVMRKHLNRPRYMALQEAK